MDKEAETQIVYFLSIAQKIGKDGGYLDVWGNAKTLLNQLRELGYRKVKEKPPLLTISSDEADKCRGWAGQRRKFIEEKLEAQRNSDIKWYEGAKDDQD